MTSSTSNSKPNNSAQSEASIEREEDIRNAQGRRKIGLYTVICGGLMILVSMGLVNIGIASLRYSSLNPFSIERIQATGDNLGAALELPEDDPREVVYVLGSSLIHFGFSPDLFDEKLNAFSLNCGRRQVGAKI